MILSIVVPVYNVEKYLSECIESILNQTFRDYELILVDDGSTDRCPQICDEFALKDERIRVIHQKNAGVSAARNAGIENANGKYVMFVDSDDYIAPTLYENLLKGMSENTDLVISGLVRDYGHKKIKESVDDVIKCNIEELRKNYDTYPSMNSPCAKLYKRELIYDIRFDEGISMGEDLLFNLKYYEKCRNIVFLPVCDYFYDCTNANSATHKYKEEYFSCQKQCYIGVKKFKYGEVRCTNDRADMAFCHNSIQYIQSICYLEKDRTSKKKQIKSIVEDELFQTVCTGKYSLPLKFRIPQKLCKRKSYNLLIAFFRVKKLLSKFR